MCSSRTVRSHDDVHLAGLYVEIEPPKYLFTVDRCMQISNSQHQPTLPSSRTPSSFRASTANSIGNSCSTCLQKPLTICRNRIFNGKSALLAIEDLVFTDLGNRGFVFDLRCGVLDLQIRKRVRAALVPDQQRVALRVIPSVLRRS